MTGVIALFYFDIIIYDLFSQALNCVEKGHFTCDASAESVRNQG